MDLPSGANTLVNFNALYQFIKCPRTFHEFFVKSGVFEGWSNFDNERNHKFMRKFCSLLDRSEEYTTGGDDPESPLTIVSESLGVVGELFAINKVDGAVEPILYTGKTPPVMFLEHKVPILCAIAVFRGYGLKSDTGWWTDGEVHISYTVTDEEVENTILTIKACHEALKKDYRAVGRVSPKCKNCKLISSCDDYSATIKLRSDLSPGINRVSF